MADEAKDKPKAVPHYTIKCSKCKGEYQTVDKGEKCPYCGQVPPENT